MHSQKYVHVKQGQKSLLKTENFDWFITSAGTNIRFAHWTRNKLRACAAGVMVKEGFKLF